MSSISKAWAFLSALSITLIVFGHSLGGREGLLFALILALAMNSFIYFYEDRRVIARIGGRLLEGRDSYGLHESVRRLAIQARVPSPKILILPSQSPQAAVVGRGVTHGTIILTEGLLKKLSRPEIESVLAYQIASLRLLNTLAFAVGSFLTTLMLAATETLDTLVRVLIVEKKDAKTPVSQLFTRLLAPITGMILRLSIRPSFYLNADKLAGQLIGDNHRLAQVLWKLSAYSHTLPMQVPLSTAHVFIVSPLTTHKWKSSFKAQPEAAKRIQQLIGYYPI